ncbi:MFS general substrate transporter [Aspergillus heteromorphus CBS 117.55]|uniref:MFS general substrate transporter n=1 Tax=Aspergillus heteromorphus CBS 117.55 TaxID=1448321 RepID=A0A317WTK7_9EURO|nr:MFS general substrate transporter [Aspergillus heteromorphus CBS 117.55]PWY89743.1 MFS general substrate transporter [Aspergillus heteromorphus CBS 117.55]
MSEKTTISLPADYRNPASFEESRENPCNFSRNRKLHVVVAGVYFVFNSSLGSSLSSGADDEIARQFAIPRDGLKMVLPTSLYMAGFAVGPLLFGPLSEHVGRKPVLVATYSIYLLFTMGCALASTFAQLLVFRFFCGLGGSAPNAVLGGLFSDIYNDPHQRGLAMSWFMFATTFPPLLGPIISGFVSTVSWRWAFWAGLIIASPGLPFLLTMPETYTPVLLRRGGESSDDSSKAQTQPSMLSILGRPFAMFFQESIVFCCSMYLALVYSTLYLYFQAYPIVFQDLYGMTPGIGGLAFLPILPGSILAFIVFFLYSSHHTKALQAGHPWARVEEYRRLPLACIGAPAIPIALFWLGWSANPSLSPIMPMMSGVFFGFGYLLIFIALLNYLTDAYKQFSASASAAASTCRSVFAVCLPLATTAMYGTLGIDWASSLLGFFSVAMAGIPFLFIRFGARIRAGIFSGLYID